MLHLYFTFFTFYKKIVIYLNIFYKILTVFNQIINIFINQINWQFSINNIKKKKKIHY